MICTQKLFCCGRYGRNIHPFALDDISEVISDYEREVYDYRNLTLHDGQVLVVVISRLSARVTVLYSYDHEERLISSSLNIFITFLSWFGCTALSL